MQGNATKGLLLYFVLLNGNLCYYLKEPFSVFELKSGQLFSFTPMAVNSISFGSPHVRPMGRTRGAWPPNETKKNTHPKCILPLFSVGGRVSGGETATLNLN